MSPLLEVKNLSIIFEKEGQESFRLEDIHFSIQQTKTLGIVGESGSGKSVTSLAIMSLLRYTGGKIISGEILYRQKNGQILDLASCDEKTVRALRGKEIAMIFQEPMSALNPVYRCGNQVAEVIEIHFPKTSKKDLKKQVLELFEKVKLPDPERIYQAYPHEISGGQKQRVMIAMALALKPQLLIADEPTTALDVTVQKNILELLTEIQQETGTAILFISHDLGVIGEISDDVLVMFRGKQIEHQETKQLFLEPKDNYTKGLLACKPTLETTSYRLPTVQDFLNNTMDNPLFHKSRTVFVPEKKQALLSVKNLNIHFEKTTGFFNTTTKTVKAVDNVSFDLFEGETLGLVGESGCGKSTLSRAILQLIPITRGEIIFQGQDLTKLKGEKLRKIRKDLQIILQDPFSSLNPKKTVKDAILEPMKIHGIGNNNEERNKILEELFQKVGLEKKHINRYPHEFSGGQRQRICIARTLALKPKLIICDESVSALDVSVQAQVLNLLNDLKEEFKFTYIFISHDLSVVKYMSDRLLIMKNGKFEEEGSPSEIYLNPKSEYTKTLIQAIPKGVLV